MIFKQKLKSNRHFENIFIRRLLYNCQFQFFFQSTSNYVARRFGVRSAMPGFIAKKLCPQLKIVHGSFDKYREASSAVGIFGSLKNSKFREAKCLGKITESFQHFSG